MSPGPLAALEVPFGDADRFELRAVVADRCADENLSEHVIERVRRFVRGSIQGRIYIYPAGVFTRQFLDVFLDHAHCQLLGLIDHREFEAGTVQGWPVVSPDRIPRLDFDYVLLSHYAEAPNLYQDLLRLGVDEQKIIIVLSSIVTPEYDQGVEDAATHVRYVIVRSGVKQILADDVLTMVLPRDRTMVLRPLDGRKADEGAYPVLEMEESWRFFRYCLLRLRPAAIYLQVQLTHYFLYELVRATLPSCTVVMEMWDLWAISMDAFPGRRMPGLPERHQRMNRLAEVSALRTADLVISKRGGRLWRGAAERIGLRYGQYHVGAGVAPPPEKAKGQWSRPLKVVYASGLNTPDTLEHLPAIAKGRDPVPLLATFRSAGFETELFNADHLTSLQDPYFASTMEACAAAGIRYRRRFSPRLLFERLSTFDYGLVSVGLQTYVPDHQVVFSATAATFAAAGVPMIVFADLAAIAELVSAFGAGIVASTESPRELAELVRSTDLARVRRGVRALSEYLRSENGRTLSALSAVLAASREQRPLS